MYNNDFNKAGSTYQVLTYINKLPAQDIILYDMP